MIAIIPESNCVWVFKHIHLNEWDVTDEVPKSPIYKLSRSFNHHIVDVEHSDKKLTTTGAIHSSLAEENHFCIIILDAFW